MEGMTDQEVMAELESQSPLNKARIVFSAHWSHVRDALDRQHAADPRADPIELRRIEFDAVKAILCAFFGIESIEKSFIGGNGFTGAVSETLLTVPPDLGAEWQPIETAPKGPGAPLIDIVITNHDGSRTRWADCYYDQILDQWRTSRPSGELCWVPAEAVTHWRMPPELPSEEEVSR